VGDARWRGREAVGDQLGRLELTTISSVTLASFGSSASSSGNASAVPQHREHRLHLGAQTGKRVRQRSALVADQRLAAG
jgi:hypothetical protein